MDQSQSTEAAAPAPASAASDPDRPARDARCATRHPAAAEIGERFDLDDVRFDALRSAYHHEDREQFYTSVHRVIMFAVTLSGTAAFASYNTPSGAAGYFSLIVAVLGLVDLVYDLSTAAREHGLLRSKFLEVFADAHAPDCAPAALTVRLMRLYAEEPASHRIADALAYNAAVRTLGKPEGRMFVIPFWQQALRHFMTGAQLDFQTRDEVRAAPK